MSFPRKAAGFVTTVATILTIASLELTSPAHAQDSMHTYQFNLPATDLISMLEQLGERAHVSLVYDKQLVLGKKAPALSGRMKLDEALKTILQDTGIIWSYVNGDTVVLKRAEAERVPTGKVQVPPATTPSPSQEEGTGEEIEQILVTAQKRSERLQDVPVPVTVVNADALTDNGLTTLREYASTIPGFAVVPNYEGLQFLSIRGITTGGTNNPTVAVMIDGVPVGASIGGAGNSIPDLDPYELARIEVLRGPQGTLYGASNMGGLVNYVTREPSTTGYSGRVEAGTSSVYNGAEPGYNVRASGNIPLGDNAAIRLSAFERQDPGYIDNPVTFQKGVNRDTAYGARLAAMWSPSKNFSAKATAFYQDIRADGISEVLNQPGLGDLQQNYMRGTGPWDRAFQAYNLTLDYKIGGIDLTSVTGYNLTRYEDFIDFSVLSSSALEAERYFSVTGVEYHDQGQNYHKFSQELRASLPLGGRFDLLIGVFYTKEDTYFYQTYTANDPVTGQVAGLLGYGAFPGAYDEYAGFADLTFHITEQLDIQLGARESHDKVSTLAASEVGVPMFKTATPITVPEVQTAANAFTYLATPEYKFSPDLMIYARLASGYRPGGPNSVTSVSQGAPPSFTPDKTYNYEIGTKGNVLDHGLSFDLSVYYIDWKNIQLKLDTQQNFGYAGNGGNAKSEGVEIALDAKPWTGLTAAAWFTYDDAVITQPPPTPAVYLYRGERLAYNPAYSANVSLEQAFSLVNSLKGYIGTEVSYVGDRYSLFTGTGTTSAPRQLFPAYTRTDLRAGVRSDSWAVNFYADNVADVRGMIGGGAGFFPNYAFFYIQPRTVGVNLSKVF